MRKSVKTIKFKNAEDAIIGEIEFTDIELGKGSFG